MSSKKKPSEIPDIYEVQINPNTLAIVLERALQMATRPLCEELIALR